MRRRFLLVTGFVALLVAGALSASTVAGSGPLGPVQTESSTTASTTTGSTATSTTTTTSTASTTTTTTTASTTTTTTTTTTPRKITICHHSWGKKGLKHVTIRISRSAWPGHRKHGDSIGACNTAAAKKFHSNPKHVKRFHKHRPK